MTTLQPTAALRVGDHEREAAAAHLGQALAQGYLDMAEYEDRIQQAFGAHTADELRHLLADLPIHQLRRHDPRRHEARHAAARLSVRLHLAAYLVMVVVVLTVWTAVALSTDATYFWPIWPILGAGIGLLGHAIPIRLATRRQGSINPARIA
ncbi:MAG: DUF1707 domain-containing protein [Mycobacterium sp.]